MKTAESASELAIGYDWAARTARGGRVAADSRGDAQLRVLFVNDHLYHAGGVIHGVTRYLLDVLPRLSAHAAVGACFFRSPAASSAGELAGIPVYARPRARWDPRSLADLAAVVREFDPDVMHLAGLKGMSLGRIAARATRRRSVIHFHDLEEPGLVARLAMRSVAGFTDAAVAVSDAAASSAISTYGIERTRMRVIPNGIVPERFARPPTSRLRALRASLGLDQGTPVVGVVGRITEGKGQAVMIRAFPAVRERLPNVVLVVVGDGVARGACEAEAARLGIASAVRFAGQRQDVAELLHVFDVVAVPSKREGFSLAALEAMAAGRPVVAFRVGGLSDLVVHGETGLLVTPGDANALAATVGSLLADRGLVRRMGARARMRASEFSLNRHVDALLKLYSSLVPGVGNAIRTATPTPEAPTSKRSGGS